ncbi:MAG: hypothetical protein AAGI51_03335 [Pseudomonadota bacterium]
MQDEIAAFFEGYVEAFRRRDAAAISERWEEVGLFPSPGGNFALPREAFQAHCERLLAFYDAQGVTDPVGELLSVEALFPGVAQARMAYRMLGEDGGLVAAWEHVYILRKSDRWRVSLTIADGEMAAWAALGAEL